ncbi:uncharacterized protein [Ranitomeya imitator]|uniref:uncharacterized protein n=1 Tax=Ranitomeya imitator TaxID=111125 RepID=UPI0037E7DDC4
MELLIGLNTKSLATLDSQIDTAQTNLKSICSSEDLSAFSLKMNKHFDEWEAQIRETHSKKLSRDMNDYKQKKVYRWKRPNMPPHSERSTSVSSVSSSGEFSDSSTNMMSTRFGKQKRKWDRKTSFNKRKATADDSMNTPKVINLSSEPLSETETSLLTKGLSFSPASRYDHFTAIKDLNIFARSLIFKKWFHNKEKQQRLPILEEEEVLEILEQLQEEHEAIPLGPNWGDCYRLLGILISLLKKYRNYLILKNRHYPRYIYYRRFTKTTCPPAYLSTYIYSGIGFQPASREKIWTCCRAGSRFWRAPGERVSVGPLL